MSFGDILQEAREDAGFSQKQIGDMNNISQSAIASYENGTREPSLDMLRCFAKTYNVSIDYLLELTMIKKPYDIITQGFDTENGFVSLSELVNLYQKLDLHERAITVEIILGLIAKKD